MFTERLYSIPEPLIEIQIFELEAEEICHENMYAFILLHKRDSKSVKETLKYQMQMNKRKGKHRYK